MPEPTLIGRFGIRFAGQPEPAALCAIHTIAFASIIAVFGAPVGFASPSGFVTNPACFTTYAPEDAVGANFVHGVAKVGHVVVSRAVHIDSRITAAVVARTTVGSVEPHLELVATIFGQFGALTEEDVLHVLVRTIIIGVAVPGRDIEAVFHVKILSSLGKVARDVGLLAEIIASLENVVLGGFGRPEAEAIVVLDNSDTSLHASRLGGFEPLFRVRSGGRSELRFSLIAIAPFKTRVGVHAIMEEGIKFGLLPFQLTCVRYGVYGRRFVVGIVQRLCHNF